MLPCLPALTLGWQVDDYIHRAALVGVEGLPEIERPATELFSFVCGDPERLRAAVARGLWPWWTAGDLRLCFLRPLTGLTHGLDYLLWPEEPAMMHLHSLLWLALTVAAATVLFRRLMGAGAGAGLAALVFALDDSHAVPAAWLANRNAVLAAFFGILALLAHDRWRRDGWRLGAAAAPAALLAAVLANESAVAVGGYLVAYALLLDSGHLRRRVLSIVPCAAVGLAWTAAYQLGGFGASSSGVYVDPIADPWRFAAAVAERAPALLRGQWLLPGAELDILTGTSARAVLWTATVLVLAALAGLVAAALRRDPVARFWTVGMLVSVLPACSTFPSNRLLLFVSLGAAGLVGQLLVWLWTEGRRRSAWPRTAGVLAVVLGSIHLVLAPVATVLAMWPMWEFSRIVERAARSLPDDPEIREQRVVVVNTPSGLVSLYGPVVQALDGRPFPAKLLVLVSTLDCVELHRSDDRELIVRPAGGFLPPVGTPPSCGGGSSWSVRPRYIHQVLDFLFRDPDDPLVLGWRRDLGDVTVEITRAGADGRASEARFTFAVPLEDASLRWIEWRDGVYAPFVLPAVGETRSLPPVSVPFVRE